MVVDQNSPKVKKYFLLIIFFLLFSSKSYSNNYIFTKIIELDKPWGSSFISDDEISEEDDIGDDDVTVEVIDDSKD